MGRRRHNAASSDQNEETQTQYRAPTPSKQTTLSKYALFSSILFVIGLFLYAKFKPKHISNREPKKQESHSSYQLILPNEPEYYLHVLLTGSSTSSIDNFQSTKGFAAISSRQYAQMRKSYEELSTPSLKKQQLYLMLPSRLTTEEYYYPTTNTGSVREAPHDIQETDETGREDNHNHNHNHNEFSNLLQTIPSNQIFDETKSFKDDNLLSIMIYISKYLDSLRILISKLPTRRRDHLPSIHLIFYCSSLHSPLIQHILDTLFVLNPVLTAMVESRLEITPIDDIHWIHPSLMEQVIQTTHNSPHSPLHPTHSAASIPSSAQQINEIKEILHWNKIKNINDLERYLILGGKKLIQYL